MNIATKIKNLDGFTGMAALYKLSEPLDGFEYVVVSAATVFGRDETYTFGSNENGEVQDWLELPGSVNGVCDHEVALNNAGYEVR